MRRGLTRILTILLLGAACASVPRTAAAQGSAQSYVPLSNIFLIIDDTGALMLTSTGACTTLNAPLGGGQVRLSTDSTGALQVCGITGAGLGDVTASGTLANNAIALGGGTTVIKTTTTGTGVVTALGVNVGSAGAFVTYNGAGGTPSAIVLTNGTGLPIAGITGLGTGVATALAVNGGSAGAVAFLGSGSPATNDCVKFDASKNLVTAGAACGSGGGSPGGSDTQVQFNDSSSFGGDAGLVFNKTLNTLTSTGAGTFAGLNLTYASFTGNHTVAVTDGTMECLTNACTFTLPTAVGIQGRIYSLKNLQTANALTIATTSSQTVDGASPGTISNGCLDLQSDNANWRIIGSCGLPLASLTSGGVIYASSTTSVASSALLAANALVLGGGAGAAPATAAGLTTDGSAKLILGVNTTTIGTVKMFGNTSGDFTLTPTAVAGTASVGTFPARSGVIAMETGSTFTTGTIQLAPIYLYTAGVCQNTTASIGLSLFTSNTPTATCKTGTNTTFGVAQYTATSQQVQGILAIPYDLTNTTVLLKANYMGETTSTGNVTWTFSYARVAAGSTLDPSWTDITVTDAAGTSNQLNQISQSLTLTSLAANDLLFWKFTYTTAPTTPGNQDLISLSLVPVRTFTIGG